MTAKKAPPPPPPKTSKRTPRNPNSGVQRRLAGRTDETLSAAEKAKRDRFVAEYLVDFNAYQAFMRSGLGDALTGKNSQKYAYQKAYQLTLEPYCAVRIQRAIDDAEEKNLINRNRVIAGLVREANRESSDASHAARVAALGKLAGIMGMEKRVLEANISSKGGILVVPAVEGDKEWESRVSLAQAALKEQVRK